MKIVSPSSMKLSTTLVLLLFITGAMLMSVGFARRCRGTVHGQLRTGVCVPDIVCASGRPIRNSPRCPTGDSCCIRPVLSCSRDPRHFVTLRRGCRQGNDQGPVSGNAPDNIRCSRNPPPRLPSPPPM